MNPLSANGQGHTITNIQKLCDIRDWFDSRIDRIIRHNLRSEPTFHRKQWEFAMLFLALAEEGMLHENAVGISFGAGKERLIFSVCEKVRKLIATDLYTSASNWVGAKTGSPRQFLLANAPFRIDPDRLDAAYMDMRSIDYPDNTFDFCYSSCAFEHISSDDAGFLSHLREVNRTLKEGGVYAMTTELTYGDETLRIPHNHFFDIHHLLDLVHQSGLHARPVFDGSLSRNAFNEPIPFPADFGFYYGRRWVPHITLLRHGRVNTSCLLVLKKDSSRPPSRPRVEGFEQSRQFVQGALRRQLNHFWKDWQYLNPNRGKPESSIAIIGHEDFEMAPGRTRSDVVFHSSYVLFGQGPVEIRIDLFPASLEPLNIKLVSSEPDPSKRAIVREQTVKFRETAGMTITLKFNAEPDKVYAVLGRGAGYFHSITLHARKI